MSIILFSSCGIKIPEDKINYTGLWANEHISLSIARGGKVDYKKVEGGVSTSINAPIQEFVGDNFIVGALGINTTFVVSETPHQEGDTWYMTVDGVKLKKIN